MKQQRLALCILSVLSAALMSLPWLVPHAGFAALFGFVPLLCADAIADQCKIKKFWICHYLTFVLWNAATTFWVCNATMAGGIFAILVNALQMSIVWGIFRLSKKHFHGVIPYIFLAAMWIAWEKEYFNLQISWPWLTLGNAFAGSVESVQWYEYTGSIGGSLWVWVSNLTIFGLIVMFSDGLWKRWNVLARLSSILVSVIVIFGPFVASRMISDNYQERSEGKVNVIIAQPNFDPYQKFQSMSQAQQNDVLTGLFKSELARDKSRTPVLLIGPETFTGDIVLNDMAKSATWSTMNAFLKEYPYAEMLFGASTYQIFNTRTSPSILARKYGDGWIESHNSAFLIDSKGGSEMYHKSKLVVGTELTPYPKIFVPLDDWLSRKLGSSGLMGRCIGQDKVSVLHYNDSVPIGCAICYESVYGEYCTGYENAGAKMMTVITNDAWWGNTPGYRQHMSYSRLRAIELRRDIARCGNTGISAIIDQKGEVLSQTPWWTRTTLKGTVNLNSQKTFFATHGDVTGRVCTLIFLLLFLFLFVSLFIPKR